LDFDFGTGHLHSRIAAFYLSRHRRQQATPVALQEPFWNYAKSPSHSLKGFDE
jgi:hypothetical protein